MDIMIDKERKLRLVSKMWLLSKQLDQKGQGKKGPLDVFYTYDPEVEEQKKKAEANNN